MRESGFSFKQVALLAALAWLLAAVVHLFAGCATTVGPSVSVHYPSDPDVRCMTCDGQDVVIETRNPTDHAVEFECYSSGEWHRWSAAPGTQRSLGQLMNAERFGRPCRVVE